MAVEKECQIEKIGRGLDVPFVRVNKEGVMILSTDSYENIAFQSITGIRSPYRAQREQELGDFIQAICRTCQRCIPSVGLLSDATAHIAREGRPVELYKKF